MTFLAYLIICCTLFLSQGCTSRENNHHDTHVHHHHYTLRLKWRFNASTLGELYAKEMGIYKKHGLQIALKEGGAETDAITELELGRSEFAVASGDQILRAVSKGADCVVLGQIFQKNPLQWIYIKERVSISTPKDLRGKTIGVTYGGNDEAIMRALIGRFGMKAGKDLRLYAVHYDYGPFWRGEVDLWPCYRNTQGVFLAEKIQREGHHPGFLAPHDYAIDFVANSIITTRAFAEKQPRDVEAFLNAEKEAWESALNPKNQETSIKILKKYSPELNRQELAQQITATRSLVLDPQGRVGTIDYPAWRRTLEIMIRQGLIKNKPTLDRLFLHHTAGNTP